MSSEVYAGKSSSDGSGRSTSASVLPVSTSSIPRKASYFEQYPERKNGRLYVPSPRLTPKIRVDQRANPPQWGAGGGATPSLGHEASPPSTIRDGGSSSRQRQSHGTSSTNASAATPEGAVPPLSPSVEAAARSGLTRREGISTATNARRGARGTGSREFCESERRGEIHESDLNSQTTARQWHSRCVEIGTSRHPSRVQSVSAPSQRSCRTTHEGAMAKEPTARSQRTQAELVTRSSAVSEHAVREEEDCYNPTSFSSLNLRQSEQSPPSLRDNEGFGHQAGHGTMRRVHSHSPTPLGPGRAPQSEQHRKKSAHPRRNVTCEDPPPNKVAPSVYSEGPSKDSATALGRTVVPSIDEIVGKYEPLLHKADRAVREAYRTHVSETTAGPRHGIDQASLLNSLQTPVKTNAMTADKQLPAVPLTVAGTFAPTMHENVSCDISKQQQSIPAPSELFLLKPTQNETQPSSPRRPGPSITPPKKALRKMSSFSETRHFGLRSISAPSPLPSDKAQHSPRQLASGAGASPRVERLHSDILAPTLNMSSETPGSVCSRDLNQVLHLERPPYRNLRVSFADVGSRNGHAVMIFLGLGAVRYLVGLYDDLAVVNNLRLICIDRWGLGKTDEITAERRTVLGWSQVVEEVADRLKIGRFSLLAHSAGAPYAVGCAIALSNRVVGPVNLLAPWVGGDAESSYKWLRYIPDTFIRTAQAADWHMQAWRLGMSKSSSTNEGGRSSANDELPSNEITSSFDYGHGQSKSPFSHEAAALDAHLGGFRTIQLGEIYEPLAPSLAVPNSSRIASSDRTSFSSSDSCFTVSGVSSSQAHADSGTNRNMEHAPEQFAARTNNAASSSWEMNNLFGTDARSTRQKSQPKKLGTGHSASDLLRACHAESSGGGSTADLLAILGRSSQQPWGFSYTDVKHPVRVWHGDKDIRVSIRSSLWMESALPECRLTVVKDAGHNLMTDSKVIIDVLESIAKNSPCS